MSPENKQTTRAAEVIKAYGANSQRWPESERAAIEREVHETPELERVLREEEALDGLLSSYQVEPLSNPALVAAQIATEPRQLDFGAKLSLILEGLAETMLAATWKPAIAASVVLVVGIGVGSIALDPVEDWAQAEQYSFALIGEE